MSKEISLFAVYKFFVILLYQVVYNKITMPLHSLADRIEQIETTGIQLWNANNLVDSVKVEA